MPKYAVFADRPLDEIKRSILTMMGANYLNAIDWDHLRAANDDTTIIVLYDPKSPGYKQLIKDVIAECGKYSPAKPTFLLVAVGSEPTTTLNLDDPTKRITMKVIRDGTDESLKGLIASILGQESTTKSAQNTAAQDQSSANEAASAAAMPAPANSQQSSSAKITRNLQNLPAKKTNSAKNFLVYCYLEPSSEIRFDSQEFSLGTIFKEPVTLRITKKKLAHEAFPMTEDLRRGTVVLETEDPGKISKLIRECAIMMSHKIPEQYLLVLIVDDPKDPKWAEECKRYPDFTFLIVKKLDEETLKTIAQRLNNRNKQSVTLREVDFNPASATPQEDQSPPNQAASAAAINPHRQPAATSAAEVTGTSHDHPVQRVNQKRQFLALYYGKREENEPTEFALQSGEVVSLNTIMGGPQAGLPDRKQLRKGVMVAEGETPEHIGEMLKEASYLMNKNIPAEYLFVVIVKDPEDPKWVEEAKKYPDFIFLFKKHYNQETQQEIATLLNERDKKSKIENLDLFARLLLAIYNVLKNRATFPSFSRKSKWTSQNDLPHCIESDSFSVFTYDGLRNTINSINNKNDAKSASQQALTLATSVYNSVIRSSDNQTLSIRRALETTPSLSPAERASIFLSSAKPEELLNPLSYDNMFRVSARDLVTIFTALPTARQNNLARAFDIRDTKDLANKFVMKVTSARGGAKAERRENGAAAGIAQTWLDQADDDTDPHSKSNFSL